MSMALPPRSARHARSCYQLVRQISLSCASSVQHCPLLSTETGQPKEGVLSPLIRSDQLLPASLGQSFFCRLFSSQSPVQTEEDHASWHFPVAVGSRLSVDLHKEAPGLTVGVNSDPEGVTVQCKSDGLQLAFQENTVGVAAGGDVKEPVQVWVPERFCTVEVKGGLGSVSVNNINQGDLQVETTGGPVDLGKIRSEHVTVNTGGGPLNAKLLSGAINLHTGGGNMGLGQLIGNRVVVESGGGHCKLKSVYAESFDLNSDGGDIHIETMGSFGLPPSEPAETSTPVEPNVRIDAGEGNVRIDKLDGAASIRTSGGNVTVQLTDKTQLLKVHMDNGDLTLSVPPLQDLRDLSERGQATNGSQPLKEYVIWGHSKHFREQLASLTRDWRCTLVLEGTPALVKVDEGRGWMEALQEKLSQAGRKT